MLVILFVISLPALLVGLLLWISANMRAATHEFIAHVREGRYDRAYSMTSGSLRSQVPPHEFQAHLEAHAPSIRRSAGAWINGFGGSFTTEHMDVWIFGSGLPEENVCITIVKEDGSWKVDHVTGYSGSSCDDE